MARGSALLVWGTLMAAAALGSTARAAARVPVRVSLEVASCVELEARQVEALVRVSATVVPRDDETAVGVKVACAGETLVITARRRSTGSRTLRRLLRLQEVGEASRARLVSLAVTELATALDHAGDTCCGRSAGPPPAARGRVSVERAAARSGLAVAALVSAEAANPPAAPAADDETSSARSVEPRTSVPAPATPPAAAPDSAPKAAPPPAAATTAPLSPPDIAAPAQRDARPDTPITGVAVARAASPSGARAVHVVLLARGGAERFPRAFGTTASGGLRLSLDGARRLGLTLDVQGSTARVPVSAGSVTVTTIALVPSLHAAIESDGGRWGARAGAGPKLGLGVFGGSPSAQTSPTDGHTFSAPWAGISAFAAIRARPAGPLVLELSGEGGVVVSPLGALVAGQREVAIDGTWIALFAAAGVLL